MPNMRKTPCTIPKSSIKTQLFGQETDDLVEIVIMTLINVQMPVQNWNQSDFQVQVQVQFIRNMPDRLLS